MLTSKGESLPGMTMCGSSKPHTVTMLKLTTVEHASSSASGGSGGVKKKAILLLEELLQGTCGSTQLGS